MNDPIVDEIRRIREAHAARFDCDPHAIFPDIKKREKERGLVFVDGVARQPVRGDSCRQGESSERRMPHPPRNGRIFGPLLG